MTIRKNKFQFLIIALIVINLITSFYTALAQSQNATGTLSISECTTFDCVTLTIPSSIATSETSFLPNEGGTVSIVMNYPLGEEIRVNDSRSTSQFRVFLDISDLKNATDPTYFIEKTNIGIISFNNNPLEEISMDGPIEDNTVIAMVDPDINFPDGNNITYEEVVSSLSTFPPAWITYFPPAGSIQIIEAPFEPAGRKTTFNMGLAFLITTPGNPYENLIDGTYTLNATFTLTE